MNLTLDGGGALALLLVLMVAFAAAATAGIVALARIGGLRLRFAVLRYDFWLDLRGVPGRRRRELRRELHANLVDSAARVGDREAVRALGPLRTLAAESDVPDGGPRWGRAASAAVAAFSLVLVLELLAAMWWMTAAEDSGVAQVSGSLVLFPASVVEWRDAADATSMSLQPGWLVLAAAAVTFAVVSRPWLALHRRRS